MRITDFTELTTPTSNDLLVVVDVVNDITKKLKLSSLPVPSSVTTALATKQDSLVSGVTIKTVNSQSLLGAGDIPIPIVNPSGVAGAIQFSNGSAFASDASNLFWDDTNNRLGVGTNAPSARVDIKGVGATSATTSLLVQNSAGTELFKVRDDGAVNMASSFTAGNITTTYLSSGFFIFGNGLPRIYNVNALNANLSVNTTGIVASTSAYSTSTASAVLEATSTSQGFLPPRMTTTQKNAIASPAAGLVVYDSTTNKLCCYNGSTWNDLF
jgi:hypothetical protein